MREYETTFIVQPEISEEGLEPIFERLDAALARLDSHRLLCQDLGKRKLAYEINRFQKGHYFVLRYLDDGRVVPELERAMRLEESVLRYLTVLVEPEVKDLEARKAEAAEQERIEAQRAAERAAREAEEEQARREHELERARVAEEEAARREQELERARVAEAEADASEAADSEESAPEDAKADADDEAGSEEGDDR